MNMFSRPSANEVANNSYGSVALSLLQVFGDLGMGLMVNGSVICHHLVFSAFFTLSPVSCSFLSPPSGGTTRPVSKNDLCYHQHPSKCIYSPTGLPGWSATLPRLYGDTWLLASTGERHEDDRKWPAVTFSFIWTLKICKVTVASKACQDNYCPSCRHQSREGGFSTGQKAVSQKEHGIKCINRLTIYRNRRWILYILCKNRCLL